MGLCRHLKRAEAENTNRGLLLSSFGAVNPTATPWVSTAHTQRFKAQFSTVSPETCCSSCGSYLGCLKQNQRGHPVLLLSMLSLETLDSAPAPAPCFCSPLKQSFSKGLRLHHLGFLASPSLPRRLRLSYRRPGQGHQASLLGSTGHSPHCLLLGSLAPLQLSTASHSCSGSFPCSSSLFPPTPFLESLNFGTSILFCLPVNPIITDFIQLHYLCI